MKKIIELILGVICVSSFAFFYFSQKNDKISLEISQPEITKISLDEDNNSVLSNPDKVYIYNIPNDDIFLQRGDNVSDYITVSPDLRGKWILENDKPDFLKIVFTPEKDWLAGKKYKVSINKKIFNTIKIKQENIDIDFFHNKLLNNIIEINHFDEGILGIYKLNNKKSNKVMSFKTNLKKVNSAIIKSKQPFRINLSSSKVRIIKNNNFCNQSKIYRNKTDDKYKFFSKSLNNIKNSINSVNNSINVSTIIHSKHKDNKSKKYVKILEKKMKEKLSKIVNIDDVNCCYHKKVKKEENTKNNENKIVTYLIESNKCINPFPKRVSQYEKQQIFIKIISQMN